jgi:membrane-associated phospholipid phosphatase
MAPNSKNMAQALSSANRKPYTSWNLYFLVPFFVWVVSGGIVLISLDRQTLFAFANTHHSSFLDGLMVYITSMGEGFFACLVLLILLGRPSLRNWWYFLTAAMTNILPNICTQLIKNGVHAPRPLNYFNNAPWIHIDDRWPHLMNNSFPSGHTTSAFCLFSFLAFLLPPRYKKLGFVFFLAGIAVAYSRMYLAAHFFLDVYVGSIIATIFTAVIVAFMNRHQGRFFKTDDPGL